MIPEREPLIMLIQTSVGGCAKHWAEVIADHILAKGIIVLPCKVGDTVYYISTKYEKLGRKKVRVEFVDVGVVDRIIIGQKGVPQIDVCNDDNVWTLFDAEDDFGKTVFLTRGEAEKALKGGEIR